MRVIATLRELSYNIGFNINSTPIRTATTQVNNLNNSVEQMGHEVEQSERTATNGFSRLGTGIRNLGSRFTNFWTRLRGTNEPRQFSSNMRQVESQVQQTSNNAGRTLSTLGEKIRTIGATIASGYAIILSAKGLMNMAEEATKSGHELFLLSQKMHITASEADYLDMVLSYTNTGTSEFISTMTRFNRSIVTAGENGNTTTDALKEFGVNLKDNNGKLIPLNKQLDVLAESYNKAKEAGAEEDWGLKLFGVRVQSMIPLLENYADAKDIASGTLQIDEDIENAEKAYKNYARLKMQLGEFKNIMSNALLPIINIFTPSILKFAKKIADFFSKNSESINVSVKNIAERVIGIFKRLWDKLSPVFYSLRTGFESLSISLNSKSFESFYKITLPKIGEAFLNLLDATGKFASNFIDTFFTLARDPNFVRTMAQFLDGVAQGIIMLIDLVTFLVKLFDSLIFNFSVVERATKTLIDNISKIKLSNLLNPFSSVESVTEKFTPFGMSDVDTMRSQFYMEKYDKLYPKKGYAGSGVNIPGYFDGTENHQGGLAIVGEQGAELVNLPKGSQVTPASDTKNLLTKNNNVTISMNNNFTISGNSKDATNISSEIQRSLGNEFKRMIEDYFYQINLKNPAVVER